MPWRGPQVENEAPTLGNLVIDFIEAFCAIPDGNNVGKAFTLTDEQALFILRHYQLHPDTVADLSKPSAAFTFARGSQLVRPQKWGKGPLSAAMICAEAGGPVLFDGWDANGEPVGRPWATPWIQVTAVSEDQTDNVWRALVPMIELGSLTADIPDTGQTRINLPGGGRIEPVTSSGRSRLGQRITCSVQDETHSWLERNGGWKLADNQRRNLSGMGGRFIETTNAWDPTEESVAQRTNKTPIGVNVDFAHPPAGSVRNKRERRRVMRAVYGGSHWVDLDRVDLEVEALLEHDPAQAERFFLNRIHAGESVAFDLAKWSSDECAKPGHVIPAGELITIGVDGARFDDALGIVATDVVTGFQWPLAIIEAPAVVPEGYEHDFAVADQALVDAFERYDVFRVYIDPERIEHLVDTWQGRWGDKRVIKWYMSRLRQTAWAVRNYRTAISAGDLTHDGDETLTRHVGNARRMPTNVKDDDGRPLFSVQKDRPGSPNKIDGAAAGVISWEARGDAIALGAKKKNRGGAVFV